MLIPVWMRRLRRRRIPEHILCALRMPLQHERRGLLQDLPLPWRQRNVGKGTTLAQVQGFVRQGPWLVHDMTIGLSRQFIS